MGGVKKVEVQLKKIIFKTGFFLSFLLGVNTSLACTVETPIREAITPVTLDIVKRSIDLAKKEKCSSVLIKVNTPGGSLPATRLIVQEILNSPVPFLCLVSPLGAQATSAGAIILQACHVSGALKGTNLGASTPVLLGKQMDKESDMRRKAINDTVSFVKTLTDLRGRNKKFGEEIVTQAKSVTAKEAFRLKAIDFVGSTDQEFLRFSKDRVVEMSKGDKLKVKVGELKPIPLGFRYSILTFFADPQFLYLLFLGSLMLLYFELTHPGVMIPGVVGGIGLILALIGLNALSVVWGAVALVFVGLVLFILEMFIPSFGILGVGGIVSFVIGSIYLFDPLEMGGYQLPLFLIFSVSLSIGLLMLGAAYLALKTLNLKRDFTGMGNIVGKTGEVTRVLENSSSLTKGWILIHGENWKVFSKDKLKVGDMVKVLGYSKMTLKVEKVEEIL